MVDGRGAEGSADLWSAWTVRREGEAIEPRRTPRRLLGSLPVLGVVKNLVSLQADNHPLALTMVPVLPLPVVFGIKDKDPVVAWKIEGSLGKSVGVSAPQSIVPLINEG